MSNRGLGSCTELTNAILNDPIRIRYTLMLSEVFKPRRHHECFEEAPALSSILEDVPGICAVALPLLTQILDGSKEVITLFRCDTILDCDQHRASICICIDCQDRRGPIHRRRKIITPD